MRGEPSTAALFARSRRWGVLAVTAVALAVCELVLPAGPVDVPIGDGRNAVAVYIVPLLLTAVWVICVAPPSRDLERLLPGRVMRVRRAWWYVGATLLLAAAAAGALGLRFATPLAGVVPGRSVLLGVALATGSAIVLTTRAAWAPPFAIAVVLWLYGTTDQEGNAASWAVPLYPAGSVPATVGVVVLWVAVGTLYVVVDGRAVSD